jgi:transcriptional regulator with XRE-family HTH domain
MVKGKRELSEYGIKVKMALLKKGMSQRQLCKKLGCHEVRLSELLRDVNKNTRLRNKINQILDIDESRGKF